MGLGHSFNFRVKLEMFGFAATGMRGTGENFPPKKVTLYTILGIDLTV